MTVERVLPTAEAHDLIDLVRDLVGKEVAPRAAADEATGRFPREVFTTLGYDDSALIGVADSAALIGHVGDVADLCLTVKA
ncbi:acyl-CoA dehydrogenase family protein, partial [Streptosporangium sandarakinum]